MTDKTYTDHQKTMFKIQEDLNSMVTKAWSEKSRNYPELQEYKITVNNFLTKKAPQEKHRAFKKLVEHMLYKGGPAKTQVQLIAEVQSSFPTYIINPNIFHSVFTKYQKAYVKTWVDSNGGGVKVSRCNTLSAVQKKLHAAVIKSSSEVLVSVAIAFTPTEVLVGKDTYTVSDHNGYPSIRVTLNGKRTFVRVDVLRTLFDT